MSLIKALQSGDYNYISTGNNNNVTIKTGNGNNNINVTGGNIDIQTGNGNQTIFANSASSLNIETGSIGQDYIDAKAIAANIVTNDSDDTIKFVGTTFDISALGGNNTILAKGDATNNQNYNSIKVGAGNDQIVATSNNLTINDSEGNLTSLVYGNNFDLNAGNGNHTVGFWGNNVDMNFGDGNNSIKTLDKTIATADSTTLGILTDFGVVDALDQKVTVSSEIIGEEIKTENFDAKAEIAKRYNLSDQEKAILNTIDLNAKFSDGGPLYVLVRSPQKSAASGRDVYVIARRDGDTHTRAVSDYECIATDSWKNQTISGNNTTTKETTTKTTYFLNGVSDVNITAGNGDNNIFITGDAKSTASININVGDNNNGNNIVVNNGFTVTDVDTKSVKTGSSQSVNIYEYGQSTWNSPLVVDFNKDGQVSAVAGRGVDIDNNGAADGAATAGDKMLAMSDINGNGKIDGNEVFGDKTVSPFTGKTLSAANGFEALKLIAEEAKTYTGVDCMKNGNVDLKALKTALATVGVNLGFISDSNTTELEDLAHVASINVSNYSEQATTGDIQHRQLGSYTDTDGNAQKVDDVWFTAQQAPKKIDFMELLKKLK